MGEPKIAVTIFMGKICEDAGKLHKISHKSNKIAPNMAVAGNKIRRFDVLTT